MDLGAFHTGTFKVGDQLTTKGIAIKVGGREGNATVLFDPELLRVSAAWTGGFLEFPRGRGGLEGQISPVGEVAFRTAYAPGWASGAVGEDPRERHQGNLPADQAKWRGLYLNGDRVVLSYSAAGSEIFELPGYEQRGEQGVFTRTFQVGPGAGTRTLLVADLPGSSGTVEGNLAMISESGKADPAATAALAVAVLGLPEGGKLAVGANGRVTVNLPATKAPATFQVVIWSGKKAGLPESSVLTKAGEMPDLAALTKAGPARWGSPLEVKGTLGSGEGSYVADEIPLPEDNPYHSWFRPGGHDFLANGVAVLASVSGDVWLVEGLDDKLEKVRWKRFATGLFQPLGLKVVKDQIYVLGRDQITRLHDSNGDGEADFYENFNNDCIATDNYHEFALDLETDAEGNFFFAKGSPWTPTVTSPHQGCMMKVSKDGKKMEIFATGLRAPNGLSIGPKGTFTVSDNQGHWMPANRLNIVKQGSFMGMVTAAHREMTFRGADGTEFKANPSARDDQAAGKEQFWGQVNSPTPLEGYDAPLCWIPMQIDNSPGGEVWVPEGNQWGPLAGRMLHLSYGKCALFNVLSETVDGVPQGGLVKFPLKFTSGIMRGRFSPKDGQLYLSGLRVWQSDAAKDGCFTRVRYTGKPWITPLELRVTATGVDLVFSGELDAQSATDPENFSVEQWNYLWSGAYGSPDFSVLDSKKKGRDLVEISKLTLSPDRRTLSLTLGDRLPAMQMKIRYKMKAADGQMVEQEIYNTINRIPGQTTAAR